MPKRKKLIHLLALTPIIFIPAIVLFVGSLVVSVEQDLYEHARTQIEQDFLETEKSRVRSKVQNMVNLVSYRQSIINQRLHDRIQRRVEDAHRIGMTLYKQYVNKMPEAELKQLITEALRPLVWNGGESFIWILDFDGHFQLAPSYLKSLEGSSIIDFEDATGRKVIREEIAIAKTQRQGFLWDTFTKPDEPSHKQFKQLAYVKNFGIYDWYLGSAEYLDTATRNTNEHLLETINQVSQGETDYFFVIDAEGTLLLNYARPDIVGKNILKTDNEELKTLYKNILKSTQTQEGGFLTYDWPNPRTAQLDSKTTFVKMVPQSHWIIGSGFYPKSLENSYTIQEQRLTHMHEQKIRHLNKLTGLSVLISLLVSIVISILFYRILAHYQYELIEANNELKDLNIALEKKVLDKGNALRRAQQEIEGLAVVDNLTQVANRYKLMKRLNTEIDRANRFNESFSVVMLDIDFFKKINDEYGRSVGDQVLQELASLLMAELRTVDLLGRFGDEEFLIIMPNTLLEEAFNAAERMRKKVECYDFELNLKLTISLGVAQYHANEQVQDLIKNADMALYRAKNSGRNQTGQANDV